MPSSRRVAAPASPAVAPSAPGAEPNARHSALRALYDAARDLLDDAAIIDVVSDLLARHLGANTVLYFEASTDRPTMATLGARGRASFGGDEQRKLERAFAHLTQQPGWGTTRTFDFDGRDEPGVPTLPPKLRAVLQGTGISVPIVKDQRRVAAMVVLDPDAARRTADEIGLCEDLAEAAWTELARARAEAALLERERAQALLIDWTDRVRGETDSDAIIAATLEMLGQHLGVRRATYSLATSGADQFIICGEWKNDVPSIAGAEFSMASIGQEMAAAWERGEVYQSADAMDDPRLAPAMLPLYEESHIRAFVSVPLIERGRVRASLSVQQDTPRPWRDSEVRLLRDVAERIWVVLERTRAEAELQERNHHQRFLIDWADLIRDEPDPARIIALSLEKLGRFFGVTRVTFSDGDVTGRRLVNRGEWLDGVPSIADIVFDLDQVGEAIEQAWLSGLPIQYDDVLADPRIPEARHAFFVEQAVRSLLTVPQLESGKVRSALSLQSTEPRRWGSGQITLVREVNERLWLAVERARAQSALKQRERNQAFLIDWSDRIRRQATPAAILDTTLEWLGRHLGVTRTTYAELDGDMFVVTAEWRNGVSSICGNRFALPSVGAAVDRQWHAGELIRYDDVENDGRLEPSAVERYRSRDIRAFVSVPLVQNGQMHSALSLQSVTARTWHAHEVQLIRDIAERTWVALERARAQDSLRERERTQAFLVAWNDAVQPEATARGILARTVRMLADHLGVSRVNYAEPDDGFTTLTVIEEYCDARVPGVLGTTYRLDDLGERLAAVQRSGEPVRINDTADDPLFDDTNRPLFDAIHVRSALTLPIVRRGEIQATLSVQHDTPRRWTDAEVELLRDMAERTLAVLERAQSEARLAEREAQLSAFLDNAPVAMTLRSASGRYVRVNAEFARSIGRSIDEVIGLRPADLFPARVARQLDELTQRAMNGEVARVELSEGLEHGYSSVLSIAFPIGDGSGAAKTAGFTIDLTERRRAEAALAKSRETLYQAEKLTALGSLLAGVSHELNNPLSIVVAQAVMMERQSAGTELAERAGKIRKAADRCARIVQSFLAMARQKRPEREAVDLNAVATAAHELAEFGLKTEGVKTLRALTPGLPPILADSDQIHQVVINLIVNAQHALVAAGVREPTLTLRSQLGDRPGTVVLEVADNGPGIPADVQRRIFEPFYTTKPQGQGTGVGLSFSQGVAEAHGGSLELVPSADGACFRLTMPIDTAAENAAAEEQATPAFPSLLVRRALVIDDEEEIAEALSDFLSLDGFQSDIAVGGEAAKTMLANGYYDLVISDLRMPDVDGPALYRWIQAERPDLVSCMAFATGDTLGQTASAFLADLDCPVLEKPFTPEAVRTLLEQLKLA